MRQVEHSAIISTFIKLPFVIKIFVLSIFECPLYTCFIVVKYVHIHIQAYTASVKFFTVCLIYCISGNGELIKNNIFISVVVIIIQFK